MCLRTDRFDQKKKKNPGLEETKWPAHLHAGVFRYITPDLTIGFDSSRVDYRMHKPTKATNNASFTSQKEEHMSYILHQRNSAGQQLRSPTTPRQRPLASGLKQEPLLQNMESTHRTKSRVQQPKADAGKCSEC